MRDRIKEVKSGSLIYTDVGKDMIIEGVGEGGMIIGMRNYISHYLKRLNIWGHNSQSPNKNEV
ncbi:MAG: hypothetical protein N2746_03010 [Deltaproteobacteria bacterium]|nr:hypothetical protein [Deltaproteobacteria bacterium]